MNTALFFLAYQQDIGTLVGILIGIFLWRHHETVKRLLTPRNHIRWFGSDGFAYSLMAASVVTVALFALFKEVF